MKALVLCAGYGTRLGKITESVCKPMVRVGGKPCLEHIVRNLNRGGVHDIVVNTHYRPLDIMDYFQDRLLYTYEKELFGEDETIRRMYRLVKNEYLLVANGDTITNLDVNGMFQLSGGKSIRFMDGGVYAGTKILSPDWFLGDNSFIDYMSDAYWFDIGTPDGLKKARRQFEKTG